MMVAVRDIRVEMGPFGVLCGEIVDDFVEKFPDFPLKININDHGIFVNIDTNNYVKVSIDGDIVEVERCTPIRDPDIDVVLDPFPNTVNYKMGIDLPNPESIGIIIKAFEHVCLKLEEEFNEQ